jgi:ParB family chromosome partitioning protein
VVKPERGLGRGLDALFSVDQNTSEIQIAEVDISLISPQKNQPRKNFDQLLLRELADSIREMGVLQPVLLRPVGERYEIVAGERRWRAAGIAGLKTLPALIRELEDAEVAEISLIENLQRDDLSIIEEAMAYRNMIEQYRYSQESLSQRIGKSRVHISNTMRLLGLPGEVIVLLEKKQISAGHARALLGLSSATAQIKAAQKIAQGKISVRETEEIIRFQKVAGVKDMKKAPEIADLEERLQKHLGSKAEIKRKRQGGTIEISYYNDEDLGRILETIGLI